MNADIDISKVVLKTDRLVLRAWRESDLDDFFEYASVDGVGQMAGWLPHKNKNESKRIMTGFIENKKTFAIEYNGKAIGSIGIELYNEKELPDYSDKRGRMLGFVISKDYWGRGIMPEAVKRVIVYLFEEVRLDFISCAHFIRNTRSARVQEKCGFQFLKEVDHETRYGTVEKSKLNIIHKEDYKKIKG